MPLISTGSIDVQIRTLNSTGTPVSARSLVGLVYNSRGENTFRFDFNNLTEIAHGVYQYLAFDVSDPLQYPGTSLEIFWYTCHEGLAPETTFQTYNLVPSVVSPYKHLMLSWCPSTHPKHYLYRVERKLPSDTDFVTFGYSEFPYYFDDYAFTSEAERRATRWRAVDTVFSSDSSLLPVDGDVSEEILPDLLIHDYCRIVGNLRDVVGRVHRTTSIYFYIHEIDAPMLMGNSLVTRRTEVVAPVNQNGDFSIPLIQGIYVTVEIPELGKVGQFLVPERRTAAFSTLNIHPIERYRGQ